MRIGRNEIIEELSGHIRKFGGEPGEWRVGTAKEVSGARCQVSATGEPTCRPQLIGHPSFQKQAEAGPGDGFTYREAHTPYTAADAVDYLVSALGLQPHHAAVPEGERTAVGTPPLQEAEHSSAQKGALEPGRLVFIYRKTPSACAPPASDHAAFPRRAA